MEKQQRVRRYKKKLMVSINENTHSEMNLLGVTSNISLTGICIDTEKILPIDKEIKILVAAEGDIYTLTGTSIWNHVSSNAPISTGISLNSSSQDYLDFVNKINYH